MVLFGVVLLGVVLFGDVLGAQSVDAVAPVLPLVPVVVPVLVPVVAEPFVLFALSPPVAAAPPAVALVPVLAVLEPAFIVPLVDAETHGPVALLFAFGTVLVVPLEVEGVVPVVALDPLLLL